MKARFQVLRWLETRSFGDRLITDDTACYILLNKYNIGDLKKP